MICCKIVADYANTKGNISKMLEQLASIGQFLWDNNTVYFSNTEDENVDVKTVKSIVKKAGYKQHLIIVYDKECSPQEGDYINGWIMSKLITINYNMYERRSQDLFKQVAHGLDLLDQEIDRICQTLPQDPEKSDVDQSKIQEG